MHGAKIRRGVFAVFMLALCFATYFYGKSQSENLRRLSHAPRTVQYDSLVNFLRDKPDLTEALAVKLLPSTWESRYIRNKFRGAYDRDGIYLSIFSTRGSGAIAHVIAVLPNGERYYLMSRHKRIVAGKSEEFFEPPGGFFNGVNSHTIPDSVLEHAERTIQMQQDANIQVDVNWAYQTAYEKYYQGKLKPTPYQNDANLLETAKRELREKSGMTAEEMNKIHFTELAKTESPYELTLHYLGLMPVTKLPKLGVVEDRGEVQSVEWVNVKDISIVANMGSVQFQGKQFSINPFDEIPKHMADVLKKTSVLTKRNSPPLAFASR